MKNIPDRTWSVPLLAGVVRSAIQNTVPSQITGLVATAVEENSIAIAWDAEVNSAMYHVYVDGDVFMTVLETGANSALLTGLDAGTIYEIQVSGENAIGDEGTLSSLISEETEGGVVTETVFRNWPIMNVCCMQGDITQGVINTTWRAMVGEKDVFVYQWFYPTAARLALRTTGLQWIRDNYPFSKMVMYVILNECPWNAPTNPTSSAQELTRDLIEDGTEGNTNWYVRRLNGDKVGANFSPLTVTQCNVATNDAGLNSLGERYDEAFFRMIEEEYGVFLEDYCDGFFIDNCNIRPPDFYLEGTTSTTVTDCDFDDDGVAEVRNLYTSASNAGGRMWEEGAINMLDTIKARYGFGHACTVNASRWDYNYFDGSGSMPLPLNTRLSYGRWPDLIMSESVNSQLGIVKSSSAYTFNGGGGMSLFFRRTTLKELFLAPDSESAYGRAAVMVHATTIDRTPTAADYWFARLILGISLMMPRCAPTVSIATTKPMALDELFLQLGDPVIPRTMGVLNEATLGWTMRPPDFENGVADFHFAEFELGLGVLRTDSPPVGTVLPGGTAVSCTLPFAGSGKKWQRIDSGTYVNPITGYAMRDQDPTINTGADVTSVSLRPYEFILLRRVDA